MALGTHSDSYGRRFYVDERPTFHIEPTHSHERHPDGAPWHYITTHTGFRAVTHDWYLRGGEKDFDVTEHFCAPTREAVETWIAARAAA
jgi:hypothetical protein